MLGGWHYTLMPGDIDAIMRAALAAISGGLVSLGLVSFWGLLRGHGRSEGSRAATLRRAHAGDAPAGDGLAVISGTIRASSRPLTAPLSGAACVAYRYRMYYRRRGRKGPEEVPVYWGFASRAFVLETPSAPLKVLAVPVLHVAPDTRSDTDTVERARRFVAETAFETTSGPLGFLGSAVQAVEVVFSDDDGEARRDWASGETARDVTGLALEETILPVGVRASASGHWSVEQRALVAGGAGSVTPSAEVTLGAPEQLAEVSGSVPASFGRYLATAIALTAAGVGLVWFTVRVLPTLR